MTRARSAAPTSAGRATPKKPPTKAPMSAGRAQLVAVALVLALVGAIAVIVIGALQPPASDEQGLPGPDPTAAASAEIMRADSHALTTPAEPEVTVVEFLDFQCPGCAGAALAIAELKAEHGDRVAIVARHFPLTSIHPHAVDAALAFEAAAAQGAAVEMYDALFATQQEWSSFAGSQAGTFRQLADDLGLDLAEYDRVLADPATLDRIARDRDDALGLGLQGTPAFFVDGEPVQLTSFDDLRQLVEAKLD